MLFGIGARPADAQMCAGRASFNLAPTHLGLDAGASRDGRAIGASVGYGTDFLFGFVSAAAHTAGEAGRALGVSATLATDQPLSPDNKLHVCPMVSVGYVSARDRATGDRGRVGVSAAADASMLVMNTPGMRVAPTIGLDLPLNGVGRYAGLVARDASRSESTFSAGIGFVLWNRLAVVPRLVVPFTAVRQSGFHVTVDYNVMRW